MPKVWYVDDILEGIKNPVLLIIRCAKDNKS